MCTSEQRPRRGPVQNGIMQLEYTKATLAAAWILAAVVLGLVGGVTSPGARLLLAGFALVPPLVLVLFWHGPSQTMSESIHQARR